MKSIVLEKNLSVLSTYLYVFRVVWYVILVHQELFVILHIQGSFQEHFFVQQKDSLPFPAILFLDQTCNPPAHTFPTNISHISSANRSQRYHLRSALLLFLF